MKREILKKSRSRVLQKATALFLVLAMGTLMFIAPVVAATASWQDKGIVSTKYQSGNGSKSSPYQIASAGQLAYLAKQVNAGNDYSGKYFVLTSDISLSGKSWTPIGSDTIYSFSGNFDGDGHSVTGLTIGSSTSPDTKMFTLGLFGDVYDATIKNVRVNVSIYSAFSSASGLANVGGLVGSCMGTVTGCSSTGVVAATGDYSSVGGLAGNIIDGAVKNSYSTCTVSGGDDASAGGLTGDSSYSTIINSYATGTVTSQGTAFVGGLVGENDSAITNSYSTGAVAGGSYAEIGGFVGDNLDGTIKNCYSTGTVTGGSNATTGGFLGHNYSSDSAIYDGYWSMGAASQGVGEDDTGTATATEMSLADMQGAAFVTALNSNITSLKLSGCQKWKSISGKNNGCPVLDGVGVGHVTVPVFGTVKYSTKTLTNKNVTVTIPVSYGTQSSLSHTFTANGSYTFVARDSAGNKSTKTVKISNIDKTAPAIKANVKNNGKIHGKVKVTVSDANLMSKSIKLGGKSISWGSGTFTKKGKYAVSASDKAGNKSSYNFTIY